MRLSITCAMPGGHICTPHVRSGRMPSSGASDGEYERASRAFCYARVQVDQQLWSCHITYLRARSGPIACLATATIPIVPPVRGERLARTVRPMELLGGRIFE